MGFVATGAAQDEEGPYQPGAPVFGDLLIEGEDTRLGATVALVGDGFGPESSVVALLRESRGGDVVVEMDSAADSGGGARVEVILEAPIEPGSYTAALTGQTVDGATIELSNSLAVVAPEPTPEPVAEPEPTTPLVTPAAQPTRTPIPAPTPTPGGDAEVAATTVEATPTPGGSAPAGDSGSDGGTEAGAGVDTSATSADGDTEAVAAAALPETGATDDSSTMRTVGIVAAALVILGGVVVLRRMA